MGRTAKATTGIGTQSARSFHRPGLKRTATFVPTALPTEVPMSQIKTTLAPM